MWMSGAEGSNPSFTLRGSPVSTERRSFSAKSSSGIISSAPRRRMASWRSTSSRTSGRISFSTDTSITVLGKHVFSKWLLGRTSGTERSEEHTSELQSRENLVCRLLLEKKKKDNKKNSI